VAHAAYVPALFLRLLRPIVSKFCPKIDISELVNQRTSVQRFSTMVRLFYYIAVIMMAMDLYYFTTVEDNCTSNDDISGRAWVFVEIVTFYINILASLVFMVLSKFFINKSGLEIRTDLEIEKDFLAENFELA